MLSTSLRLIALCGGFVLWAAPTLASTRVGIYAVIDDVMFEPSDREPERVWISGTFVVPVPISSGDHGAPRRGHLYFGVNADARSATLNDWAALRKVAGTGKVVGFGQYWMPCSHSRVTEIRLTDSAAQANCSFEVSVQTDLTTAVAEQYPAPSTEGVVTVFDREDDLCPRFGRPSVDIVGEILAAHSPGVADYGRPVCKERIGLLASSDLARTFPTQVRDGAWAATAEALILRRITEARGLQLSDLAVECRDTVCHIHLVFPSRDYQQATGNRLAADALDGLPGFANGAEIVPSDVDATIDYYYQRRKLPAETTAQSSPH